MLRIRFHGRGGQGMKTASRILGSAAFHAGYVVQDAPVYGAERRGAPMAAFTRIATEPIRERGAIARPDLVIVADETLLPEPSAQPLAGCDGSCTLLINTPRDHRALQHMATHGGRLLVADFTTLVLSMTQTLASLSTALGIAAACLVGLRLEDSLAGVNAELAQVHLTPAQQTANVLLARTVYAQVQTWAPVRERSADADILSVPLVDMPFDPPSWAAPSIYAAANSPQRRTGSWRQFRPVLQREQCTRCWLCFVWCPEAAISLDADDYPVVDYEVCKGCLLCAHECPTQAYSVEQEGAKRPLGATAVGAGSLRPSADTVAAEGGEARPHCPRSGGREVR
jgi:pyruvate ferredoxin oxidoreductase gamma subunit